MCSGEGRVEGVWFTDVTVPAGSAVGGLAILPGLGQQGARGGRDGDLIIMFVPRRTGGPVDGGDYTEDLEIDEQRLREGGTEEFVLDEFEPCVECDSSGCDRCVDSGWPLVTAQRTVVIPSGSSWGTWLRVPGEGVSGKSCRVPRPCL